MLAEEVTKHDLLKACESLFGSDVDLSVEFLRYLKPAGLKAAYRQRAMETHPDRAAVVEGQPDYLEQRFKEINLAYQLLQAFLKTPWKYMLDEAGTLHKRREQPVRPATHRQQPPGVKSKETLYHGRMPARRLLLGQYLYYAGRVSLSTLIKAIVWQKIQRPALGAIASSWGWINGPAILDILRTRNPGEKFGECALRRGYLSRYQLTSLLNQQKKIQPRIGKYFVEQGIMTDFELHKVIEEMKGHNRKYWKISD